MKRAAATAGMLSAAILLAHAVPASAIAQAAAPGPGAAVDPARALAAAELINVYQTDAWRQRLQLFFRSQYIPFATARLPAENRSTPARVAVADFVLHRARDGMLRDLNLWFDSSKQQMIAYLASRHDADYLRRMIAMLRSRIGVRILARAYEDGFWSTVIADDVRAAGAEVDAFVQTITDEERREVAGLQHPGEPGFGQTIRELAAVQGDFLSTFIQRYYPSDSEIRAELMRLVAAGQVRL